MVSKFSIKLAFKTIAFAAIASLLPAGCAAASSDAQVVTSKSVGVQMFEWTWNALAKECTNNLGPAGYNWVEVSPPQEHIVGDQWWVHYQPTSYKIESNLGTRAEFANMVDTCGKAGVAIIADAVINHMAASDTIGWAGTKHTKYDYPGLYQNSDFHHCASDTGAIEDWSSLYQVQECELLGLADLDTAKTNVQSNIIGYLKDLRSLGVKGFRIDAAKHIALADLKPIVAALPSDTSFLFEVYDGPADPAGYRKLGNTFEFNWARSIKGLFNVPGMLGGAASPSALNALDQSSASISLVANHDTERDGSTLNYLNGKRFEMASMFMLAIPYGKPMVYSGYSFSDRDAGPDSDSTGKTIDATCPAKPSAADPVLTDGKFVCQHRWAGITGMIQWRKAVGDAKVSTVYDRDSAYGFSRGKLGYVLFNTGLNNFVKTVKTGLVAGTYCNQAVTGTIAGKATCATKARIIVAKDGSAKLVMGPISAVAFSVASRIK
jgi:alpha-amylase